MTSKEFKIWLDGFLTPLNLDGVKIRPDYGTSYNHLTMLKTIHNKLKDVNGDEGLIVRGPNNILTENLIPAKPPNPFEIKCENKKENNE